MNKTLLILGTGQDQISGIKKAKEMKLYTIGLDVNEDSPGAKLVDKFYKVSVKDFNKVVDFAKNYKNRIIDGVIAFGVDIPDILAKTAEILNVEHYTSYELASESKDKYLAKERMRVFGVNLPEYRRVKSLEDLNKAISKFGYPCVLKPTDNSGARGVIRLTKDTDSLCAYNYSKSYSITGDLILEKFIDGMQISSESILINSKVYTVGLAKRNYEYLEEFSPFIIENGGDLPPENLNDNIINKIDEQISKASKAFKVKNGIVKGDLVIKDGNIYVIEVALRLSGGHFSSVEIFLNTGIDFLQAAIKLIVGEKIDINELTYKSKNIVFLRYIFPYKKGKIRKIKFPEWMNNHKNIASFDFYYKKGDFANYPTTSHPERLGYFIVYDKNRKKAENLVNKIYKEVVVEIK